jgi:ribonuclease HI
VVYSPGQPRTELVAGSEPVAAPCTNNVAEFAGLVHLLTAARRLGVRHLRVHGDSKLVVSAMQGSTCLKSKTLRPLYKQAKDLLGGYAAVEFTHVHRDLNPRADTLAKNAAKAAQQATAQAQLPARTTTSGPSIRRTLTLTSGDAIASLNEFGSFSIAEIFS